VSEEMELALLIIFNIFMGAVFYLIISLKLERSASEFREKRLRKVMDDIIQEFNATAERNITILENKITVMKKLLERSGDLSSVDIELSDENRNTEEDQQEAVIQSDDIPHRESKEVEIIGISRPTGFGFQTIAQLFNGARDFAAELIQRGYHTIASAREKQKSNLMVSDENERSVLASDISPLEENADSFQQAPVIERDYHEIEEKLTGVQKFPEHEMDEQELSDLFSSADDRYSLISDLYEQGYTVDIISKCSGIPIGEIKLVLNLSNP
jgi:hypothetical protein